MKKINLSVSEWLGLVTMASAIYSYIYYYKFWRFFGVNAYDYFSYVDALQHSISSIIIALVLFQSLSLSLTYFIFFDRKTIVSFYRYSSYLAKTSHYNKTLKQSIAIFVLIFVFGYFLEWFLRSGLLSSGVTLTIALSLSVLLIVYGAFSFSYFFMLSGIKAGAGIKRNLIAFYFCQVPLHLLFSSFHLPIINAYYFKTHDNAQAVFKDGNVLKTQRLLGITKDYFIVMEVGRGVVRKTDTLQYVVYNEN
ncbi:hypothetical protein [Raoultella planticola]|uniref:hypothetical protein n=1 Tax=Raoultella planticola TaxID=575 RepID=UPI00292AB6C6|nr:hypothetical protein [Raoultella planticola]HBR5070483.1 hypothetical protein [Klebsiella pneumoniae]